MNYAFLKTVTFTLLSIIIFSACNEERFYEKNLPIENELWNKNEPKAFEVEVKDTLAQYDFYINLRNSGAYPYANLFLFLNTVFPNGEMARDTLELFLADPAGKWLGTGSGDIYDNRIMFKKDASFPIAGSYKFEFEHAMRQEDVPHIIDIGMRIEKNNKK